MSAEGEAVARVISDYARSWSLLHGCDEQALAEIAQSESNMRPLVLDEAWVAITEIKHALKNVPNPFYLKRTHPADQGW